MDVLGISAFYHDSAVALVRDGRIIAAAQEERFTRKKHDQNFPFNALKYCLKEGGTTASQLDLVGFYDKPLLKFERILQTYLAFAPKGFKSFAMSMPLWIKEKLWLREAIRDQLGYSGKILFPEHHESHAASAFFPSPFQEAAIITMDGVGEWTTTSYGAGRGNKVELLADLRFPHSLGLLYSAFTYYTGFKVNSGEYKVMGLAPYGEPRYVDVIFKELMDLKEDGSFKMNMEYFGYCAGLTMTNEKFHRLFGGPPREPESNLSQRDMDLAASVQAVTEEVMLRMARHARKETGLKNLCLAGGVALNCVGNGKIWEKRIFDDIWIQPAAGDAGGALGAALLLWHQYLDNPRQADGIHDSQQGSFLGPCFTDEQIETFLRARGAVYERLDSKELPRRTAELLAQGKVIGWFQGRMEFGPRALGARSILGDPRDREMQSKMNLKIKFRESFRPFAPVVMAEEISNYFEMEHESPYMLLVAPVRKERRVAETEETRRLFGIERLNKPRSDLPAITHIDYSARIQSISRDSNAPYYDVIKAFKDLTGCAVLVNTSYNVRGEPIVCTPEHAYVCFMRTDIDTLAMGNFLLDKTVQPKEAAKAAQDKAWMKEFVLD
ncbi:MAG: carbamoyltransferase [Elusimicrobia bacterium]|nr:carbamoyltransferase [Elusimicrobiota bacterium]